MILDLLADREPFNTHAKKLFGRVDKGEVDGFTSPSVFSNLFYLLRKQEGSAKAKSLLKKLRILLKVLPMDDKVLDSALASPMQDFEDALQYHCSAKAGVDTIITRNGRDYKGVPGSLFTPEEFLKSMH
ncbi:MAG: PIN domain-containing protein [Fibrobacterota bacterium]|nr:PIN domain-containing protein [Fibrobacterota bacterium]